ncbi:MAG TPA: hypothetical protein VHR66_23645 [Gemmataceae bacterium]|jgi:hypothetical protein|nr:hypothetical protein [Gemmataceae bacterium]
MRLASPRRRRRLTLESLERRDNPTGTVNAAMSGTILTLNGDDADNSVQVQQTGSGAFTVTGTGTTITGGPNFTGVTGITANFGAGNDSVQITSNVDLDGNGPTDLVLAGAVTVNVGDGNNTLSIGAGQIKLGGLSVTGGDGADGVSVVGGMVNGSKISGNVVFNLGIGVDSQVPPYLDTTVDLEQLDLTGAGGLKFMAGEGPEALYLTGVNITKALSADGGDGNLSVVTNGGTIGSVSIKSMGPSSGLSTNAAGFAPTGTTVTGAVNIKSNAGANATLTGATTGAFTLAGGSLAGSDTTIETNGVNAIHGNLKVTGNRHSLIGRSGSSLTVDGDINISGTGYVDLNVTQTQLKARNVMLNGALGSNYYSYDDTAATAGKLTATGSMTLKGRNVTFSQTGGEVAVTGKLTLQATIEADFNTQAAGFVFDAPRAKTSAASLLVKARKASYLQTESDATFASGLSVLGTEGADFESDPRTQNGTPPNVDTTVGSKTTVSAGTLLVQSKSGAANFYQTDGVTTATGLSVLAADGALIQMSVGDEFNAPGAKILTPSGLVLVQGSSAELRNEGGDVTAAAVSVLGDGEAAFSTENGSTTDQGFNSIDVPATSNITGPLKVDAGVGDLTVSIDGDTTHVVGDMTLSGAGLNRIWLESQTEVRVDGNLTVAGATGNFDWFLAWGPLTVGKNLSVDLGGGANDIETGTKGGNTTVGGKLNLKTGNGSDTLYLAKLLVAGATTIDSGAGSDKVYLLSGSKFSSGFTADLGGGADQFLVAVALPDPFSAGNIVDPGPVEFDGSSTVQLGSGNDKMVLGVAGDPNGKVLFGASGSLAANGGANQDTFDAAAGQFPAGNVTPTGFELP